MVNRRAVEVDIRLYSSLAPFLEFCHCTLFDLNRQPAPVLLPKLFSQSETNVLQETGPWVRSFVYRMAHAHDPLSAVELRFYPSGNVLHVPESHKHLHHLCIGAAVEASGKCANACRDPCVHVRPCGHYLAACK